MQVSRKIKIILASILFIPFILMALYTWFTLSYSFSEGDRAGYMQKISKKGWLCKTWEGELALVTMPGAIPEKFLFTVKDETVAKKLSAAAGKRVIVKYEQHKGVPSSCFGDTEYFVEEVSISQN